MTLKQGMEGGGIGNYVGGNGSNAVEERRFEVSL